MAHERFDLELVAIEKPIDVNVILGQAHFIRAVEDLKDALLESMPGLRFGLAYSESSGPCLIRVEGNDAEMRELAVRNARALGAGHSFLICLRNAYPTNALNAVKGCPEVSRVLCATANPVQAIVAGSELGRGILGVIDGRPPCGVEDDAAAEKRRELLRQVCHRR
jgi:adenosine/AMP kinase